MQLINCTTMASPIDIHDRLVLNLDQEAFRKLAVEAVDKLTTVKKINGKNRRVYADFTVTIEASMDRRDFTIYRNRSSVMVIAVKKDNVVSMCYEFVYIEDHIKKLLKDLNGKGTKH